MDKYCKYDRYRKYVSYDGGQTWQPLNEYEVGELLELNSQECGYVSSGESDKYSATYSDGKILNVYCNGDGVLDETETQPSGYDYSKVVTANIGDCVTRIEEYALFEFTSLRDIDIPDSVEEIGFGAFAECYALKTVNIGTGMTHIGNSAFHNSSSLESVTILAEKPFTLGYQAFDNTNNCPIYVPDASVDAYKAEYGWAAYASRVKPLSWKP